MRRLLTAGAALVIAGLAACGDDDEATVDVILSEWIVQPDPAAVDSGSVRLDADNVGGLTHEVWVAAADSPDELPLSDDGAVDEAAVTILGEVRDVGPGESGSTSVDLEPGRYQLVCNIVEDDGTSHFAEGMHATLVVE